MNWVKITKSYTDFSFAGLTTDIEIYQLPAGVKIHGTFIKTSISFAGGAIATYTLSTGISTDFVKYSGAAFDVFQAVTDTTFRNSELSGLESWGASTSIRAKATSTGANLDQATQGTVDIFILVSKIKT